MTGYRFFSVLNGEIFSIQNHEEWEVLKWKKMAGPIEICRAGYHFCFSPYDSLQSHFGNTLAKVEIRGPIARDRTKCCAHSMRILRLYSPTVLYSMAAMAAQIVLPNFEEVHPEDKRPRSAVNALEECIQKNSFPEELFLVGAAAARAASTADGDGAAYAAESASSACVFTRACAQGVVNSIGYLANAVYYAYLSASNGTFIFKEEFDKKVNSLLK